MLDGKNINNMYIDIQEINKLKRMGYSKKYAIREIKLIFKTSNIIKLKIKNFKTKNIL